MSPPEKFPVTFLRNRCWRVLALVAECERGLRTALYFHDLWPTLCSLAIIGVTCAQAHVTDRRMAMWHRGSKEGWAKYVSPERHGAWRWQIRYHTFAKQHLSRAAAPDLSACLWTLTDLLRRCARTGPLWHGCMNPVLLTASSCLCFSRAPWTGPRMRKEQILHKHPNLVEKNWTTIDGGLEEAVHLSIPCRIESEVCRGELSIRSQRLFNPETDRGAS